MEKISLTVEALDAPVRADRYIAEHSDISRSRLKGDCTLLVNGKEAKLSKNVSEGDVISLEIAEVKGPEDIEPQKMDLDIIYEDDNVIVLNKAQGVVVHPAAGHYTGTLVNAIMYHCKDSLSGINGVMRPGIVHRIDRDTSGSLIICKNDTAHQSIAEQLKEHSAKRIYRGIVTGHLKENSGTVDAPMERDKNDRKKMCVPNMPSMHSKKAVTHYEVTECLNGYDYASFRLETGRTHQIRVHMAYLRHPLLGDTVYGPDKDPYHTNGQVLHAEVIGFKHPRTGEYMEFSAPLPDYFLKLLDKLRQ